MDNASLYSVLTSKPTPQPQQPSIGMNNQQAIDQWNQGMQKMQQPHMMQNLWNLLTSGSIEGK